jgi:hypothetical protein
MSDPPQHVSRITETVHAVSLDWCLCSQNGLQAKLIDVAVPPRKHSGGAHKPRAAVGMKPLGTDVRSYSDSQLISLPVNILFHVVRWSAGLLLQLKALMLRRCWCSQTGTGRPTPLTTASSSK